MRKMDELAGEILGVQENANLRRRGSTRRSR
jgi:hypothetical protein